LKTCEVRERRREIDRYKKAKWERDLLKVEYKRSNQMLPHQTLNFVSVQENISCFCALFFFLEMLRT